MLIELPAGLRLDVEPSAWVIESRRDELRVRRTAPLEALEIALFRGEGRAGPRASLRAAGARLSRFVHVVRNGCPFADLGTVDGGGRLDAGASGELHLAVQLRATGFAVASLDGEPGRVCRGPLRADDRRGARRGLRAFALGRLAPRRAADCGRPGSKPPVASPSRGGSRDPR